MVKSSLLGIVSDIENWIERDSEDNFYISVFLKITKSVSNINMQYSFSRTR